MDLRCKLKSRNDYRIGRCTSLMILYKDSPFAILNFDQEWAIYPIDDIVRAYANEVGFHLNDLRGMPVQNVNVEISEILSDDSRA